MNKIEMLKHEIVLEKQKINKPYTHQHKKITFPCFFCNTKGEWDCLDEEKGEFREFYINTSPNVVKILTGYARLCDRCKDRFKEQINI